MLFHCTAICLCSGMNLITLTYYSKQGGVKMIEMEIIRVVDVVATSGGDVPSCPSQGTIQCIFLE